MSIEIGGGMNTTGNFSSIDWSNGPYYLKREVDPVGGTNYTIIGTSQFLSVPYAMYATIADTVLNAPDTSSTNEIQNLSVSTSGDTLYLSGGNYVIVPGISYANYPSIDIDGNTYDTVNIGTQVWMVQNLKTTRYNDNTPIPNVTDNTIWVGISTGARCYYNNDSTTQAPIYGALYNWFAVETGKLCPIGWHVPNDDEWESLITYLGGRNTTSGNMLKEPGTTHWQTDNTGATNETGFTGLPGGARDGDGSADFRDITEEGFWWTSSPYDVDNADIFFITDEAVIGLPDEPKKVGSSVRCIKD